MKHCFVGTWLLTMVQLLSLCCPSARGENWPQWRGPADDGISKETNLPAEWSPSKNIRWQLKLPGQSGATPAGWEDRIFLTAQDGDDVVLLCIGTDGKERWNRKLSAGTTSSLRDEANLPSPPP